MASLQIYEARQEAQAAAATATEGASASQTFLNGLIARKWELVPILGIIITGVLLRWKEAGYYKKKIKEYRERRRQALENHIVDLHAPVDEAKARDILSSSASVLVDKIAKGQLTSEEVLSYFIASSHSAQSKYNALTDAFYKKALDRARELDRILKETGKTVGPLHGLPISIKENLEYPGSYCTMGIPTEAVLVKDTTSVLVQTLEEAGAIPFVKTNVPQTLMVPESSNPIYGATLNPYNVLRSPGGSSGGEAALVAVGGSPIGVGSDIGGSIRIPCHFSGLVGFKPTVDRLSGSGSLSMTKGMEVVRACLGPIARTVDDAALMFKVATSPDSWMYKFDLSIPKLHFNEEMYKNKRPLKIGYYTFDTFFTASAASVRAVNMVAEKLRQQGHELIPFVPPNVEEIIQIYYALVSADGGDTFLDRIGAGPIDKSLSVLLTLARIPTWIKRGIISHILGFFSPRMADLLHVSGRRNVFEFWNLNRRKFELRTAFLNKMSAAGVDVLLCPALAVPAFQHNMCKNLTPACSYTMIFNIMNLPAGVVPVTTVTMDDTTQKRELKDAWDRGAAFVDANSDGLPIGVQVAGLPWRDEDVLRVMKDIETACPFEAGEKLRQKHFDDFYQK